MNSTNAVSETCSSSCNQHPNMKEEIDADMMEWAIKVEDEGEEVKVECEDIEVDLKVEDEEKPTVCQCEECGSGGRGRVDRCTRAMAGCSSQAIKKEECEGDDEQSGEARRGKQTEIMVKEEVKKEEDEINMAGPSTQRCGSASADSVIIKFEDEEGSCPCEDCGMIKTEEEEEVKEEEEGTNEVMPSHSVEEEVAVEGGRSEDEETMIEGGSEDEEDWMPSNGSSLGSSNEEEEEENDVGPADLMHEPIETGPSTASLEVRPGADADTEQAGPSASFDQKHSLSNPRRQSSGHTSHHLQSFVDDTDEELDTVSPSAKQARTAKGCKRHRCPQCQKMVTTLARHLLTHTGERPHICDQCGRAFKVKSALKRHLPTHTGEKAFSCQHCGKCFTQKSTLKRHLTTHTGEKAHQCDQCPSAFVSKDQLTNHRLLKHTGERPYACHIANCDKAFTRQSYLRTHLKRHTGEKRHHCEDCEMRFVTKSELTLHRRLKHTGERPFVCHIANCDKAFASQSNLRQHLMQHTGDKRHQCEDCEMRFVNKGDLAKHHRRKHTNERSYRCPHSGCNYAAADRSKLKRHLNSNKHRQYNHTSI